jgi:hypothetical protein
MADAVLVLLIVGASAGEPAPNAAIVQEAMREAIGPDVRVLVEQRDTPSDADVQKSASTLHANAIAEVHWLDSSHLRAHVRLYVAPDGAFYIRDLDFKPEDALPDRERAMGLTAGAMIRVSTAMTLPSPPAVPEPSLPAPLPPPIVDVPPPPQTPAPKAPRRFVMAVQGLGLAGVDAATWGAGVGLSLGYLLLPALELRLRGAAAFGSFPAADASLLEARAGGGAFWTLVHAGGLRAGIALDASAVFDSVTRSAPHATREQWLPAVGVGTGVGYAISPLLEPFVEMGAETTFTTAHITVGGTSTGHLPTYRALAGAGLRARF